MLIARWPGDRKRLGLREIRWRVGLGSRCGSIVRSRSASCGSTTTCTCASPRSADGLSRRPLARASQGPAPLPVRPSAERAPHHRRADWEEPRYGRPLSDLEADNDLRAWLEIELLQDGS